VPVFKKLFFSLIIIYFAQNACASQNFTPANIKERQEIAEHIVIEPAQSNLPEYERLVYSVKWLGMPVGHIIASINGIKEINGRKAYEIEVIAKTNAFCSAIYKIDDRFVSYMDIEGFYTLRHEVYRREGRYKKDAVTDFDHINKKAHFRNLLDKSEKTIDIPYGVQDTLSACYYFRLLSVGLDEKIEYTVYNNEDIYQLFGIIESKDFIRLPRTGRKAAFHIQPYARLQSEQVRKGRVSGYFSVDGKRLPLLAIVQAPVFTEITVSLDLAEYRQK
jgi:hypothetical protein